MCLSPAITEIVHWLFAIKYWSVAVKMELLTQNKDLDTHNKLFYFLFWAGIAINLTGGFLDGFVDLEQ
jgi:hypothetical protein